VASPYQEPGKYLDVDAVNAETKKTLGFERYGYWKFFEKEDASEIAKEHVSLVPSHALPAVYTYRSEIESFLSILYPESGSIWMETIVALGALEAFIKGNRKVQQGNYVSAKVSSL
jgi:hypothetical protein